MEHPDIRTHGVYELEPLGSVRVRHLRVGANFKTIITNAKGVILDRTDHEGSLFSVTVEISYPDGNVKELRIHPDVFVLPW